MSMRFPGGLIATSPVNARYPSGVWTQAQTAPYQAQNVWTRDRFWPNTTLLLQGDGAVNGAQNNTFLDSSSNNFTITRNGNTTQGSFTPYEPEGYWSNFFDGSGDNLTTPSNAALAFGSSDFTIEAWVNPSSKVKAYPSIFGNTVGFGSNYVSLQFDHDSAARKFRFWVYNANSGSPLLESPAAYSYSNWYHVAVTRSGSTFRMFIDGTLVVSATYSGAVDGGSSQVARIGGNATSDDDFAGTVSNFRIVKGTALYTANFTPPAAPLTAITNTSLLTCQSNRFKDNSTNNFTITRNGDTSVQAFQPFPGATTWSASVLGGSGYFDGSGDFLTAPDNAAFNLSGDFTIEAWVNVANISSEYCVFHNHTSNTNGVALTINSGAPRMLAGNGSWYILTNSSITIAANTWNHIAYTRSGSTWTIWVNGVSGGTATSSTTPTYSGGVQIGQLTSGVPLFFPGYIADLRVLKGTALYTSTFTPPTAPLTAITNTSLLLSTTNAGIYDNSMMNNLETVGNAQVSTSVVKYGTGSMYFDGSGDGLYRPNTDLLNFGSGNFTIEFWINFSSKTGYQTIASMGYSPLGSGGNWIIQTGNGDGKLVFYRNNGVSSTAIATDAGPTVNNGQWYHIAIVKNGTTTTIYRDGVNVGSGSDSNSYSSTGVFYVGGGSDTGFNNYYFNGYIDDLRITKGAARYITNFTPPIARLPAQ